METLQDYYWQYLIMIIINIVNFTKISRRSIDKKTCSSIAVSVVKLVIEDFNFKLGK